MTDNNNLGFYYITYKQNVRIVPTDNGMPTVSEHKITEYISGNPIDYINELQKIARKYDYSGITMTYSHQLTFVYEITEEQYLKYGNLHERE